MISAVVHTYNEEKTVERCLATLSFADEIVVVDMGSTDKTLEKVSEFKVKIYQYPYTGYVEPARNFAIKKTNGSWIFIVDADEEVPQTLAEILISEVKKNRADYYRLPRKNIIFNKWIQHGGWWPDYQVRFFKKGYVSWTEKIHKIPQTRGVGIDIQANTAVSLIHHNYQTVDQYLTRLNSYSSIFAKQLYLENYHYSYSDLFSKPLKEFLSRFFAWKGYQDGVHGLALSLLQSLTELVIVLKLWELEKFKKEQLDMKLIESLIAKEYKSKKYWLLSEKMCKTKNRILVFFYQLQRKMYSL